MGAGIYFILILIVSWIGGKIFDDFDKVGKMFLYGEYFKGIVLVIIMFFLYYFVAFLLANNGGLSGLGLLTALGILLFFVGSDIYQCYQYYHNMLDRVVTIGMYLAYAFNDVLKIITIVLALGSSNDRY